MTRHATRSTARVGVLLLAVILLGAHSLPGATFNIANGDVAGLISAITTANNNMQDDNINLAPGGQYVLTTVNNVSVGPNGLPGLRTDTGHKITINGNRTEITRSTAGGTPDFRIFLIASDANVTFNGLIISNGRLAGDTGSGAGLANRGSLALVNCTVRNNSVSDFQTSVATAFGGAIANEGGTLAVQNCTVAQNSVHARSDNGSSALAKGGAIFNSDGVLTLKNSTFAGNFASASSGDGMFSGFPDASGAGLYNIGPDAGNAPVTISSCTFAGNTSSNGGMFPAPSVGIDNAGPSAVITVGNSIFAGTAVDNFNGMIISNGYNLANDNWGGFLTGTGDQPNTDPKLGPLSDRGGQTETVPLKSDSPAIDKGKRNAVASLPATTDQRGVPRPFNFPGIGAAVGGDSSDIGAFEFNEARQTGPGFVVNVLGDHDDLFCGTGDCTLREAIIAANARAGDDAISFAPHVVGTIQLTQALPLLNTNVAIQGTGANKVGVRRNIGGDYRIFTITNATTTGPIVSIKGLMISNGRAIGEFPNNAGAAILNDHGTLTVDRCTFSGNTAVTTGFNFGAAGGIYNGGSGGGQASLILTNSTFSGNEGSFYGGAIVNDGTSSGMAMAEVTNSTFSGNNGNNGGAIASLGAASGHASLALRSSTFQGNTATFGSALFMDAQNEGSNTANIANTILKTGTGENFSIINGATLMSQGRNISSDAAGGDGATTPGGFLNGAGDKRNTDPLLDPAGLANNGGPTQTIALQPMSPAINSGLNGPARDQRGFLRIAALDIGAFEFAGFPAPLTDFNADGRTDYLLFNPGTRRTALWHLQGATLIDGKFGPTLPAGWTVVGVADFDQSGGPDYLLVNGSTRQTAIWFLNGAVLLRGEFGPTLPSGWQLVAAEDFNGDGQPDYLLFQPNTRGTAVWFLNGTTLMSTGYGPTLPAGWRVAGALDFNANGKPDYVLFNPGTRQTAVWFLNGTTLVSGAFGRTAPPGWALIGASEFNGNGKPDFLLFNAGTRQTAIWFLNGVAFSSSAFGPTIASGFTLVAP